MLKKDKDILENKLGWEVDNETAQYILEMIDKGKQALRRPLFAKMEIAECALNVCDIIHGTGNHWSNHEGVLTLKFYALETGIKYKTISNWIYIKKFIWDKLDEDLKFQVEYKHIYNAYFKRIAGRNISKVDVNNIIRREINKKPGSPLDVVDKLSRYTKSVFYTTNKVHFKKKYENEIRLCIEQLEHALAVLKDSIGE